MPRIVDHDRVRADLLALAFEPFARDGYGATTMRGLAGAMGVSTGTLYHYFPNKAELFDQLLLATAARHVASLVGERAADESRSGRVERLIAFVEREQDGLRLTLALAWDHARSGASQGAAAAVLDHYATVVAEQLELPPELAQFVIDLLLGAVVRSALTAAPVRAESLRAGLDAALRLESAGADG